MQIYGERIKRTRLIQTEKYVVAVDVEMVIPADDPSEPCYEAETVKFLREVKERGGCHWLCQCRPELNVIVRVGCQALRSAFAVPWPGKEEHWRSQWHTNHLANATQPLADTVRFLRSSRSRRFRPMIC